MDTVPVTTPVATPVATDPEELALMADPRFGAAVELFNQGQWYPCHDGFEELWHETQGSSRKALQGILQIAVAHIHLERGNRRGATVLLGEGLGHSIPPQVSSVARKPLSIAFEEIAVDKIVKTERLDFDELEAEAAEAFGDLDAVDGTDAE